MNICPLSFRRRLALVALCLAGHALAADPPPAALVATPVRAQPALVSAGLQLQLLTAQPVRGSEGFLADKGERRLQLVVQREVEPERVGVALARALAGTPVAPQLSVMTQMGTAFAGRRSFVRGDTISFELRRGEEMRLVINQTAAGFVGGGENLLQTMVHAWVAPASF